jgi:hypothetical protein
MDVQGRHWRAVMEDVPELSPELPKEWVLGRLSWISVLQGFLTLLVLSRC